LSRLISITTYAVNDPLPGRLATASCANIAGMAKTLFTIGYEKAKPQAVLEELARAKIDLLVDTRAIAASRRAGFSKRQLAAALDEAGIAYVHLQKLGTPAKGREAAHKGDYETAWKIYDKHVKTADAQRELADLISFIKDGKRVCLLCYERNPAECHRSRIAALVRKHVRIAVKDLAAPLF
jgi:uncharacterized protein (DUF488 family)